MTPMEALFFVQKPYVFVLFSFRRDIHDIPDRYMYFYPVMLDGWDEIANWLRLKNRIQLLRVTMGYYVNERKGHVE